MPEIGEVVDVWRDLFSFPSDFFQLRGSMKGYFDLRSLHFERGIPGAPLAAIEAMSAWMRVRKRLIHDMRQAKTGDQLNSAYSRQPATLAEQSVVGCALKLREVAEQIVVILRNKIEDWPSAIAITVRNRTDGFRPVPASFASETSLPPRRASNSWRTLSKAGMPPFFA